MRTIKTMIAYYRLSRPRKGKNKTETIAEAYGLEFQRREVARIAAMHGAKIIAEYTEIESARGKKKRTAIHEALAHAVTSKSTLVIGKLERLARNVHFTSGLLEADVDFICCDMPEANKMTIQIMSVMAERYSDETSVRTKEALGVAKSQGVLLGSARPGHWIGREHRRGFKKANQASAIARRQKAVKAYEYVVVRIRQMTAQKMSLKQIAAGLNELGFTTTSGLPFTDVAVRRVLLLFQQAA